MNIFYTAEIRWFYPADSPERGSPTNPPSEVKKWFHQGSDLTWPPKERIDCYLMLPGCETTRVKIREGQFEVKAIRGLSENETYERGISGRADEWIKWSYGEHGVDTLIKALEQEPGGWLDVTKWRWLRKFSMERTKPIEVSIEDQPLQGCNTELTAIQASDSYWWTIGLEAFGSPGVVGENLSVFANHFFTKTVPPMLLNSTKSYAYPVLINSIAATF